MKSTLSKHPSVLLSIPPPPPPPPLPTKQTRSILPKHLSTEGNKETQYIPDFLFSGKKKKKKTRCQGNLKTTYTKTFCFFTRLNKNVLTNQIIVLSYQLNTHTHIHSCIITATATATGIATWPLPTLLASNILFLLFYVYFDNHFHFLLFASIAINRFWNWNNLSFF